MYFCKVNGFFMQLIQAFLEYLSLEKKYSKHTITSYKTDLNAFERYIYETFESDIKQVHYNQIRSYIVTLSQKGISNRTINRKLSALKSFYKFLMKIAEITENPLTKHRALKVPKRINVPFTVKEINEVLEYFEKNVNLGDFSTLRNKIIILLLYSTGIRREELINLTIQDVDFHQKTIKVLGKRNKERIIPMTNSLQQELSLYVTERKKIEASTTYLFLTDSQKKIYGTFVYRLINSYFSAVTTKGKKSPHILRHAFATHLINEGAEINAVKELLGHASLASTQVYVNSSFKKLKEMYNHAHPRSNKKKDL